MQERSKNTYLSLVVIATMTLTAGCAVSDYNGIPGHKTTAEAKLNGIEVAFSDFGPDLDGTYAYTVKYNNVRGSGVVTITSYRNPVAGSFTRDGLVNQDGDDIQGSQGILGLAPNCRFLPIFEIRDKGDGCQFGDNLKMGNSTPDPLIFLCIDGLSEEVDKDSSLQESFPSLGVLLSNIWSGALRGDFTLEANALTLDGVPYPIETLSIGAYAESLRPVRFSIANQESMSSVIQTILDHTQHMEPVTLGLTFEGGMSFNLPVSWSLAFDHDGLMALL